MDSQFLELFGNYLIQAAGWQRLIEKTSAGMTPSDIDVAELGRLFKQVCSFSGPTQPVSAEYARIWQQTVENLQSVFFPYWKLWGWIPPGDYQVLQKKCESLGKKIREQDQIISQLRSLLEEKGLGQIELLQRFQSLIQNQTDEFKTFITNFGEVFLTTEDRKN